MSDPALPATLAQLAEEIRCVEFLSTQAVDATLAGYIANLAHDFRDILDELSSLPDVVVGDAGWRPTA